MNEVKHTPGPWWIGDIDDFDGIAILYDEWRVPVANVPEGYSDRDAQANACLIAAAPEMLEALMLVDAFLFAVAPESNERQAVLSAIAKAQGK